MVKISAIHRTPPPLSWDFGRTGGAAAAAPRPRYKRALPMASPATATASLCCRLVRLPLLVPYARRRSPLSTRCSAAQSPDAVDREYADLNLRPLYPNVRPLLPPPGLPSLPPPSRARAPPVSPLSSRGSRRGAITCASGSTSTRSAPLSRWTSTSLPPPAFSDFSFPSFD